MSFRLFAFAHMECHLLMEQILAPSQKNEHNRKLTSKSLDNVPWNVPQDSSMWVMGSTACGTRSKLDQCPECFGRLLRCGNSLLTLNCSFRHGFPTDASACDYLKQEALSCSQRKFDMIKFHWNEWNTLVVKVPFISMEFKPKSMHVYSDITSIELWVRMLNRNPHKRLDS